ncbi:MAG: hypothetical protein QG622_3034 [Actinomycetota bacterium]|nr:hypothetical protein [Actinomycetota bacterium]
MKRPSPAVRSGAAALLLIVTLSGCSLFQRTPTQIQSQAVPVAPLTSGSVSQSAAAASPVPVASPSPTPSVSVRTPVPPKVTGYTLATPPAAVVRRFQAVSGQFRGVFSGLTARTVVKGQQQVGTVVLLALDPELVGNVTVEQRLVPGMVKGMSGQGAVVKTQKVAGQDIAVATTKGTNILAWYRAGTVVLVLANGTDTEATLAFTKAYLASQ